jgi:hypothetical protein
MGADWCAEAWVKESATAEATERHPASVTGMRPPRGGRALPRSGIGAREREGDGAARGPGPRQRAVRRRARESWAGLACASRPKRRRRPVKAENTFSFYK